MTAAPDAEPSGARRLMGLTEGRYDGHVHLFSTDLPMAEGRRYTPTHDAPLDRLAELLRANGLDGALVVQPSFLGTDNSHLLDRLEASRGIAGLTLRGVAVVDPTISPDEMAALSEGGIVGIRLNLAGTDALPDLASATWQTHFAAAAALGWHVELHIEGPRLPPILPALLDSGTPLVIDHFGRPDPAEAVNCAGFRALLAAPPDRVTVKVSAAYRVFADLPSNEAARRCAPLYRALYERFGVEGLVWGSDWPWTQHEGRHSYAETLAWCDGWRSRSA